jgi:NAD(P)-dependent dehydrogenase (short-subunit alcohol dehydrogenase family)
MPSELTEWAETDIPDLHGETAVVTGASTGLGFEVAGMLAGHGATVIMACRDAARAETAADRIRDTAPGSACADDAAGPGLAGLGQRGGRAGRGHITIQRSCSAPAPEKGKL